MIKTCLSVLALCFVLSAAKAQKLKEADVPAAVKESFKKQFPAAKVEEWEKEGENYEAEFDLNKTETCAVFDASGKWLETEVEIKITELPKAVSEYLTKTVPGKKIKEASKITDASGKITYEAEAGDDDYLFDDKGNFLRKEAEAGDDKDDDKK